MISADGRIQLAYQEVSATDGLAGLSAGTATDPDFEESDLSGYGACSVPDPVFLDSFESGNCDQWSDEVQGP